MTMIFDAGTVAQRRARAKAMRGDAFLARAAADGLAERLTAVTRHFSAGLMIDARPESDSLKQFAGEWCDAHFDKAGALGVPVEQFDLAASLLTLHAIDDLPGALIQIRRALKPDGLFMAALLGGETLHELREAFAAGELETTGGISPRVAPFADVRDLGGLLQRAGFALPVADVERTVVHYRAFGGLVGDLRALGETNALAQRLKKPLSRRTLTSVVAHYKARHAMPDGKLRATFETIYLTGWAPHESQQKPLQPGTAKARLADALGVKEHKSEETVTSSSSPIGKT